MGRSVTSALAIRLTAILAAMLASCDGQKSARKEPALAQAFVGPITLNLRREITPASPTAATAKHGEKVEVIQVRRRFVRIRTPRGEEGWTESRQLLTAEQMNAIAELGKSVAHMPSQGEAIVYSPLNMHTDPSRNSTNFFQITESMRIDVLAHQLSPRTVNQAPAPFPIPKPTPSRRARKSKKGSAVPPPPSPPAPAPPTNWVELAKAPRAPEEPPPAPPPVKAKKRKPSPPKPQTDDWYLVRTKEGKAGWVLARMVNMAIPDEVAQYAEGARIVSYFALADVQDGEMTKHHWLWTTIRGGQQPYEFDSFRIFSYVVRRHRYETSYIERDVEGYYPVEATHGRVPRFSLILRGDDGKLYRKTYIMEGYLVRKVAEEPYAKPQVGAGSRVISKLPPPDEKDEPPPPSWGERIRSFFRRTSTK
jgi:SH3-like domain-containing protein